MFPDSDTGSGDEWIDIADAQSDTNTDDINNDINSADIDDNSESEAEGYETDSEDNDIHSESRATALEDCTSESSESERELHHVSEKPQFTEDRKGNLTPAASCKDESLKKRFRHSSHNTKAACRKKLSKHTNGRERRGDKMSEDELAQLLKQRKERAAIIGQTRVRGERVYECAVVLFGGKGVRLWVSYGVCRELSGVLCDRFKVSHRNYSGSAYHTLCSGYSLVPRPLPDFISQPCRKIGRRHGIKTTSWTGNGGFG